MRSNVSRSFFLLSLNTFSLSRGCWTGLNSISSSFSMSLMICLGSFIFSTAALTIILCFLFFFNSLFLASFLAWSVGFMNFPLLVEEVERRPIVLVRLLHPFYSRKTCRAERPTVEPMGTKMKVKRVV